ncbi:hypothetical protein [uncultured Ruminococcus sp.]|uniref:hypothetical protein n=1 Tax=uncultured Ruminococcus sp. TaxID=165186 RepID=UPI000EBB9999|nr:hypothetical protein [uncultured Ruminococcus sp.]HCJ40970.1 hypothetical protein [Ruminococcus sp.]
MSELKEYKPLNDLLERLDATIDDGATVPFSNKKMVDAEYLHELVDEVRISVPPEIKRAQELEEQRKEILENSKKEAENIRQSAESDKAAVLAEARAQAEQLVSQQEIIERANQYARETVEKANQEAAEILAQARAEGESIVADANNKKQSIMEAMVANINSTLSETASLLSGDVERLSSSLDDVNRMRDAISKLSE